MMGKPSERKRQKQKARQQADAKAKHLQRERQCYAQNYPKFVFHANGAPPVFVDLIRESLKEIDFRDSALFAPTETKCYKAMARQPEEVMPVLQRLLDANDFSARAFATKLGTLAFARIPQEDLLRFIPYSDANISLAGPNIHVYFRSLRQESLPGGTIYYSRHRPTLKIDGQRKVVGFSRHAIEQICKRLGPRWSTYLGLGDVFAIFDQCRYFESCYLHDGQLAFTFFDRCRRGFFSERYMREVLGDTMAPAQPSYFRLGYCPAVVEGDYLKAKTFLFPGYRNTPEYGTILRATLSHDEKRKLIELAEHLDMDQIQQMKDLGLIKLFHNGGVPQVIQSNASFFAPIWSGRLSTGG
jgi:hypothetical protein